MHDPMETDGIDRDWAGATTPAETGKISAATVDLLQFMAAVHGEREMSTPQVVFAMASALMIITSTGVSEAECRRLRRLAAGILGAHDDHDYVLPAAGRRKNRAKGKHNAH
jgi:hypothetical protein